MALRTLNYGVYGIFLTMGSARFISSTVPMGIAMVATPRNPTFRTRVARLGPGVALAITPMIAPFRIICFKETTGGEVRVSRASIRLRSGITALLEGS